MRQNLARVWRAKTFDELIGQELSVRLLKNSLAKNAFFPVYLLSGLRGSGKTSMGRIFAAAVNCHALPEFQKNPSLSFPCLQCSSCKALHAGQHPDFIEVDAASYTGVDNVRQIIESASFLPVMGSKKIYLVDEAHMLSKAAFNAFLKILEEPPATVLFLLATTESHKILETVKSRSFQLFFEPVTQKALCAHLKKVCDAEEIAHEEAALEVLVQQSEGSVRDALTMLERVAIAEQNLSCQAVYRTLGLVHDATIIALCEHIARGNISDLLMFIKNENFENYNAVRLWEKLISFLRTLLWLHAGIDGEVDQKKRDLLQWYDQRLIVEFLELLYKHEMQFLRTTSQHIFLESCIVKMMQRFVNDQNKAEQVTNITNVLSSQQKSPVEVFSHTEPIIAIEKKDQVLVDHWKKFLQELDAAGNPMATSIFKQGNCVHIGHDMVRVLFAKKFEFYYEWIFANESLWKHAFVRTFGTDVIFVPEFTSEIQARESVASSTGEKKSLSEPQSITVRSPSSVSSQKQFSSLPDNRNFPIRKNASHAPAARQARIDISDQEQWPKSNQFLKLFPGVVMSRSEEPL